MRLISEGGDYSKMPRAEYGHDAYSNPTIPENGYVLVPEGEPIVKSDKPFDVYAGWMKCDGYDARMGHHAYSDGRWTAWERKVTVLEQKVK